MRDRGADLAAAGIRPYGISRDSVWSHHSWAMTLGVEDVPLLSDGNGEAARGFDVAFAPLEVADVAARSAFLIAGDTVRAAWMLGTDLPDVDAIVAAASPPSP
nr:redoxin domain-containing protein [Gaiella occulta]